MIPYLRRLAGKERFEKSDRHLARFLTFVAGAANAGGFLAVHQYTSHMSGIVSSMADNLMLGDIDLVLAGFAAFMSFVAGAACSAVLVNWGRRMNLQSEYALPLVFEAVLLICFGLLGSNLGRHQWVFVPATVMLLCFVMGLQNAIITKLSGARIRTTHVTGLVTDMGIELGKLFYWNASRHDPGKAFVRADRRKLKLLASLVALFFSGGVAGAIGFKQLGFAASLILAAILLTLAIVPVLDDLKVRLRRAWQ
ncbi:DUF1275 domain-containing protein [Phyllobacterium brassicacearum]|uniref:DUF1275 domain-containing protein n=1 Tax=Phyllobacterium brassicacearum TaxID=314235 RepID=A0A2P7B5F0_9HYPH|nr:DUF1275 domain-containing protein [Phyllobacterium brassicacearum]TDQ14565.1 uncharacterized membrane protein YoaK (UPF0700 family) [Phyllobacterium brassicacearum]